jgi:uncharacterized membrane protein
LICILLLTAVIAWKSPPHLRPLAVTGCLASFLVWLSHFGGATESLFVLFLFLGWILRKRLWLAAILLGIAVTCKQTACFFIPFYMVLVLRESGWRQTIQSLAIIGTVFIVTNMPFIIADAGSWLSGILGPVIDPLFPYKGVGFSVFTTLSDTPVPQLLFTLLEAAVYIAALVWYYFRWRQSPQAGLLLALIPLFFAWRSKFAYFVMIPLLVFGAVIIEEYQHSRANHTKPVKHVET